MKKALLCVIAAIVVSVMTLSLSVSAATQIHFTSAVDNGLAGDTWYVIPGFKDAAFVDADTNTSTNGSTFTSTAAAHCIWAAEKTTTDSTKYLHYTIREEDIGDLLYFYVGYYTNAGYDQSRLILQDCSAGEHIVDLTTVEGYNVEDAVWLCIDLGINANTTVDFDNFYVSDSDASDAAPAVVETDPPADTTPAGDNEGGNTSPATADYVILPAAALAIGLSAAFIVLKKKH